MSLNLLLFTGASVLGVGLPQNGAGLEHVEPGGARVVLVDGSVERVRGAERRRLTCARGEDTGAVLDLAGDPAGLTYFAAENGVFVLGPLVEHLDPVQLREGAPLGAPRSVHVDDRRRVWIATDQGVGVIDPSFGWGRSLSESDGLVLEPPFELEAVPEGLRIRGGSGVWTYRPDAQGQPTVDSVTLNGRAVEPDALVDMSFGEAQRLEAVGTGGGGAAFRFRIDRHHVWRDLADGDALDGMNPGSHLVEIVAYDRDLNLSRPFPLRFRVALPFYYGKAFVMGVGAVIGMIVLGLALVLQRRGTSLPRRLAAGVATTAVTLIFGVQILAGLVPHAKGWPFVGYSMYSKSFRPEHPVHRAVLIARDGAGVEREVPPWSLGFAIDGRWQVLGAIITGGPEAAKDALQRVQERVTGPSFNVLQVQSRRFRLTPGGPVAIAPLVLSHYEGGSR